MYSILPITNREVWDNFLSTVQPNTFLHSWQWGEFQEGSGERVWRLGVYDTKPLNNKTTEQPELIGVALVIKVRAKRGSFLFCPHGPISIKALKHESMKALVDYLKELARKEKCGFVRFSPLMLNTPEHYKMWQDLGFRNAPTHMHPELAWILDIPPPEEQLLKNMRKTTRYSIRKAEKDGVKVTTSTNPEDLEKFWAVYGETAERQHFVSFSKEYLRKEFATFAAQNCATLIFGTYRGEIISAAFIVLTPWSAFYHHGASIPKYTNVPASQLVQWHAILEAKRRGCEKYNFWGVVPETAVKHPWQGLSRFKRGFGGYTEAYVHAVDLPLAWRYWLTYTIERVRKWKRHL